MFNKLRRWLEPYRFADQEKDRVARTLYFVLTVYIVISSLSAIVGFLFANTRTFESPMAPRDMVLLFTDGLYEVENARGEFYDPARFPRAVERRLECGAEEIFEQMLAEVRGFAGREDFSDDVCLVAMEVQHLASQQEDANASTPIGGLIA